MAVVKLTELWEGRGGGFDAGGVGTLTRAWIVETDDAADDVPQVIAAVPVALFDSHPANPVATARSIDVKPHKGQTSWHVTIPYSTAALSTASGQVPGGGEPAVQDPESPTPPTPQSQTPAPDRSPTFSFAKKEYREAAELDATGTPYVNTAGDRIEGMEQLSSNMLVTITYWSLNATPAHIANVWDRINDGAWRGFAAETLLVLEFGTEWVYDLVAEGVYGLLMKCSVQLEWKRKTWKRKVLNAGFREKVYPGGGGSPVIKVITDDTGVPVNTPWPLKADGSKATVFPDDYHHLYFDDFEKLDFAELLV